MLLVPYCAEFVNSGLKKINNSFVYISWSDLSALSVYLHSGMTVSAVFVADIDRWLRTVGRV